MSYRLFLFLNEAKTAYLDVHLELYSKPPNIHEVLELQEGKIYVCFQPSANTAYPSCFLLHWDFVIKQNLLEFSSPFSRVPQYIN
jgi:hypothetical protein